MIVAGPCWKGAAGRVNTPGMGRRAVMIGSLLATLGLVAGLTGCSSAGSTPKPSSTPATPATSDNPSVVDGITIPPPYSSPIPPLVASPAACPGSFGTTLSKANKGGQFTLTTGRAAHLLTCKYANPKPAAGTCSKGTVSINTEPQAYNAFDRWNVETGQNSMWSSHPKLRPTPISGLGIEAEWVPLWLMLSTASASTWVTTTLICPAGPTPQVLALATDLSRAGLATTAGEH
jgi:hypothetical protein